MASAAAAAGAGSLWNPGSWHWESRNYNKWATENLKRRLTALTVSDASKGVEVCVTDASDVKAEATVNIRKGKRIFVFELNFTLVWEGRATDGSVSKVTKGDAKVIDLMQDDLEDEFEVRLSLLSAGVAEIDGKARDLMRTAGSKAIREQIRAFAEELLAFDSNQEKLALDAKRREEEAAKAVAAREEKGDEKARIAREQAEKEAARKAAEQEKLKAAAASDAAVAATVAKQEAVAATGSVWNVNSYHWEEKPLTGWAKERLGQLMKGFELELPGASVRVANVDLTGEASLSIRKGRKLVFFEFTIKANWEGELIDTDGFSKGRGSGEFTLNEVDQDTAPEEMNFDISIDAEGDKTEEKLKSLIQKHGIKDLRARIATFVEELKEKK